VYKTVVVTLEGDNLVLHLELSARPRTYKASFTASIVTMDSFVAVHKVTTFYRIVIPYAIRMIQIISKYAT